MIKLINAFNVQCCMTNKKHWEGRKRTLFFQSDMYRRILLETPLEDPFYHFTSYNSSTEVYLTFFTVNCLDMTTGKGLAVTLKVRYHRPGFVVSRFFSMALLGRKISFVIPRNSLFIEVCFTSRFHGLRSV